MAGGSLREDRWLKAKSAAPSVRGTCRSLSKIQNARSLLTTGRFDSRNFEQTGYGTIKARRSTEDIVPTISSAP